MDAAHPDWHELNCTCQGVPIDCVFTMNASRFATADGMYIHTPGTREASGIPPRQHPKQIRFAVSLESAAYYNWIDDPHYMCNYESEATYRSCSQVQSTMHHETQHDFVTGTNMVHAPELPYEQKRDGVAYINSNCGSPSGRAKIMAEWVTLPNARAAVHAFGTCSNNKPWPEEQGRKLSKREVFQRYKFCVAMENSISFDYITEKIWDALSSGCVPIYKGSSNILDIMPEPQAVIIYGQGGNASTVAELDALVADIMADRSRYERMLAWKHKPLHQLSPGYQRYHAMLQGGTNECRMCAHIVQRRLSGDFLRAATCLWNQTWLKQAGQVFQNVTCPGDVSAPA